MIRRLLQLWENLEATNQIKALEKKLGESRDYSTVLAQSSNRKPKVKYTTYTLRDWCDIKGNKNRI